MSKKVKSKKASHNSELRHLMALQWVIGFASRNTLVVPDDATDLEILRFLQESCDQPPRDSDEIDFEVLRSCARIWASVNPWSLKSVSAADLLYLCRHIEGSRLDEPGPIIRMTFSIVGGQAEQDFYVDPEDIHALHALHQNWPKHASGGAPQLLRITPAMRSALESITAAEYELGPGDSPASVEIAKVDLANAVLKAIGDPLSESQGENNMLRGDVRLHKEGNQFAISTNIDNERDFIDGAAVALSTLDMTPDATRLEKDILENLGRVRRAEQLYPNRDDSVEQLNLEKIALADAVLRFGPARTRLLLLMDETELARWLMLVVDIACKLRGYKADVIEKRVIIAGAWLPNDHAAIVGSARVDKELATA